MCGLNLSTLVDMKKTCKYKLVNLLLDWCLDSFPNLSMEMKIVPLDPRSALAETLLQKLGSYFMFASIVKVQFC